ncbi:translocase of inner mitochondrial membrane domain-containing protein [Plakobranchus ocellatus]|uniref:Complex I assembly factor TIMMDC1, mitochondrial n=1 Tax=Plakobranchus ocellatus TaxID=259542 RepID=A0AAV3Z6C9_9GAST|nr:translocase of inner mitochondrial membrane domain-containing protein [Plakobranchus ocellatus]
MRSRPQRSHSMEANSVVNDMQVNHLIAQETGLQRLRAMYALGPDWMFVQEDTRTITTIFYRSVVLGFLISSIQAAQSESKINKNMSASQAVMKMGVCSLDDGLVFVARPQQGDVRLSGPLSNRGAGGETQTRTDLRADSLSTVLWMSTLRYLSQSIAAYRNESSVWEYAVSGAVAMAAARFGKSPKAVATGVLGGAAIGTVGGMLICSILSSAGASQEQRTLNRIRQQLQQQHENSRAPLVQLHARRTQASAPAVQSLCPHGTKPTLNDKPCLLQGCQLAEYIFHKDPS